LFSLRVNGVSASNKYPIVHSENAIYCLELYGPSFGGSEDIQIKNNSNLNNNSYTRCWNYQCPIGVSQGSFHSKFAGSIYFEIQYIPDLSYMSFKPVSSQLEAK
jgi:hypothetical protein